MKNLLRLFSWVVTCCLTLTVYAQPGPVCTDLNIPVESDGDATIVVGDFVKNADNSLPDITIENPYGGIITQLNDANAASTISIAACTYVGRELKLVATNDVGSCWSKITFKQSNVPIIIGRRDTVYCSDPLVAGGDLNGVPPTAFVPCTGNVPANYVADWVEVYDCVLGDNVAKVIYRMYEAYDKFGGRGIGSDTIVVFRYPQITDANTYCTLKDTIYCGNDEDQYFGPFMVFENPIGSGFCDTLYFLDPDGSAADVDPKCGIALAVTPEPFGEGCETATKYTVEIKQSCYGEASNCTVDAGGGQLEARGEGYWACTFWLIDIDSTPPEVDCGDEEIIVPAGAHDCAALFTLPNITATDDCHDVTIVKAVIEGYGTFSYSKVGDEWVSTQPLRLPYVDGRTKVVYEAFDECHNVGKDSCYIIVKDLTAPIAICDKGVNVSLTGKKIWVDAETFDEGSWDNCGINRLLARRSDWLTEVCIGDVCDSIAPVSTRDHTLYRPVLETNRLENEVQAYYARTMEWLDIDEQPCGELLFQSWRYDLMKYATEECAGVDFHGTDFDTEFSTLLPYDIDLETVKQIGGGWGDAVVFSCSDACGPVTVELLAIDYWCNFNKCWTTVWVEDKSPVRVVQDVADVDISCKTYKDARYTLDGSPASLADLVEAGSAGDAEATAALDAILGGYQKAWLTPHGTYVDIDGDEIETEIEISDSICYCDDVTESRFVYDDHLGWVEVEEESRECYYYEEEKPLSHGIVAVNCAENVQCEQTIWTRFDHCGQGVIYRKFKMWQGCPNTGSHASTHIPDTITRLQQIWVGNECLLDEGMFTLPADTTVEACGIEYDPDGSGNVTGALHPDNVGRPEYVFDDDCRIVGIGHYDKVYRIVGGDAACFKVVRTWCFADWCDVEKPVDESWIVDPHYTDNVIKYVQKIIVHDSEAPIASISPVGVGNVVTASGCEFDFSTTVDVSDACGVLSYRWILQDENGDEVDSGNGDLDLSIADFFTVSSDDLGTGKYRLIAIVTDQCQNEGVAEYDFFVSTGKKPSPVCITSLTVELTPMDLDDDGVIDTGMATIWAEEFNSSSAPACDDREVEFYIEYLGDGNDETLDPEDKDYLDIGCDVLPDPFMVRMWVRSIPSGTTDYCDVFIVPQNNMNACGDISTVQSGVSGTITTEIETNIEQVEVKATLSNGADISFLTNSSGSYLFASALGLDVTITPYKNMDHSNGISTADMIKIQKHILGKSLLENELREIAADVNDDGRISALDLLELRKLILAKTDELPVPSWKFVNKIDGEESYTIIDIENRMDVDFTGIKMGDVNISNDPSRSAGRSSRDLVLEIADEKIDKGGIHMIDVKASNFVDLEGYQFTLNLDPSKAKIRGLSYGSALDMNDDNFALNRIQEGLLSTSWNDAESVSVDPDEVLFSIQLEGLTETAISEVLAVNSKVTEAEAYDAESSVMGVAVEFSTISGAGEFALYQNRPNPFRDNTVIGFKLPESTDASVTIYDVTGKVLKVIEGQFTKGYNEVSVNKRDLNVSGVLYYQLDSEVYTAARKMVLID